MFYNYHALSLLKVEVLSSALKENIYIIVLYSVISIKTAIDTITSLWKLMSLHIVVKKPQSWEK